MICVDASVAIKWIVEEEDSPLADRLLLAAATRGHALVAPRILSFEVTSALRRQCFRNGMQISNARARLAEFQAFSVELLDWPSIHDEALVVADAFGLPAAYDAHYLALAERERCDFWTADRRLLNALGGRLGFVRDLAAFDERSLTGR